MGTRDFDRPPGKNLQSAMVRFFALVPIFACACWAGAEEQQVDAVFADYAKPGSPGCAVGVLRNGATALAKGYGYGDLEHAAPLTPRSLFYMASVSKQFTSMAMLLAEQDGKLKLDDSIRKYVPELPAYADGISIRRMLDHTAGLRDYLALWALRGFSNESVLKEGSTLALIARQKGLNFAPGADQLYSNTGYVLAAIALKRATGKPLEVFARERIFKPLEMRGTRFQADHGVLIPDRAHGYHRVIGEWKTVDVGFDVIGSGGMYSNIEDMMKWARNFETPVVGAELLGTLQTPGKLVDGRRTPGGYALGVIEKDGTYSHSGGASGYSTFILRVPKHAVTVVCLCNFGSGGVERLAQRVAAVYTGEPVPARVQPEPPPRLKVAWKAGEMTKLAGSYWSEELFSVWEFVERGGRMWLRTDGDELQVFPREDGAYDAGSFVVSLKEGGFSVNVGRASGVGFSRR